MILSRVDILRRLFDDIVCETFFETRYPRTNPNVISVTEITQCPRYSWFMRREPRCIIQAVDLILGVEGHRLFLDKLRNYGYVVEWLVCKDIGDGIKICGRLDAYHPDLNEVIDIKITTSPPDEPYEDHRFQVSIYMHMVKASRGYVVYLSRDPHNRVKVFRVKKYDSDWKEAVQRAKMLRDALIKEEPPPCIKGRWCRYCPYSFECMKIEGKAKKSKKLAT